MQQTPGGASKRKTCLAQSSFSQADSCSPHLTAGREVDRLCMSIPLFPSSGKVQAEHHWLSIPFETDRVWSPMKLEVAIVPIIATDYRVPGTCQALSGTLYLRQSRPRDQSPTAAECQSCPPSTSNHCPTLPLSYSPRGSPSMAVCHSPSQTQSTPGLRPWLMGADVAGFPHPALCPKSAPPALENGAH